MRRWTCIACCLASAASLVATSRGDEPVSPAAPRFADLTPAVRSRTDRLAVARRSETDGQERVNFAGNITAWLIGEAGPSPAEEKRHVVELHKTLVAKYRTVPTPDAAERVFRRLLDSLPFHLQPGEFRYTLTVLDRPEVNLFTTGGGHVYITRPLLDALLQDRQRGEAALAFALAHELGHIGLGHTRRGWFVYEIRAELKEVTDGVRLERLQEILETKVAVAGQLVQFLYTRAQSYEADLFALQLCRNAGFDLDHALDFPRYVAVLSHPRIVTEEAYRPADDQDLSTLGYYLSAHPPALLRLKRLLQEVSGTVEGDEYGLFCYDPEGGTLLKCPPRSVAAGERTIVFVHGLRGDKATFEEFLAYFAGQKELADRKLLVFRYPNNDSLARCGRFLHNEMKRVVADPGKAFFVCHSAGGLVFRYYGEVREGGFDRAVLLGTPHEGSNLAGLTLLAGLTKVGGGLRRGPSRVITGSLPEGRGQVLHDLHADSLFLRHLGHNPRLAARYHVFYGEYLDRLLALGLRLGFEQGKELLLRLFPPDEEAPAVRRRVARLLDDFRLPEEVTDGDLIVTVKSATLKDAGQVTGTSLHHQELKSHEFVLRRTLESILKP